MSEQLEATIWSFLTIFNMVGVWDHFCAHQWILTAIYVVLVIWGLQLAHKALEGEGMFS